MSVSLSSKCLVIVLSLAGLLGGGAVVPGQAQQEQGPGVGAGSATMLLAKAVNCHDALLLSNDGIVMGSIENETLTLTLEGGKGTRSFNRDEIDTFLVATQEGGRETDRVILSNGEIFQGRLQTEAFQVRLASGTDVSLPKTEVRGAVFATTSEGSCGGPLPKDLLGQTIERLINNALTPGLVNSLSKFDWTILSNQGILSGSVCSDTFTQETDGREVEFSEEELLAILFGEVDTLMLNSGEFLDGTLTGTSLCLSSVYQEGQTSLGYETLGRVIFETTISGGGPGS